jgi:hypothetical protein
MDAMQAVHYLLLEGARGVYSLKIKISQTQKSQSAQLITFKKKGRYFKMTKEFRPVGPTSLAGLSRSVV